MTIRVIVAEDQAAVRSGLVLILQSAPDIAVVGEASDGEQTVALARRLRPDLVLMDVRMPRTDGIAATQAVVAEGLATVLVLTTFDQDDYVFGALRAGASGFLLKDISADDLLDAVRRVAGGDCLIAPTVGWRLTAEYASARAAREYRLAGSTALETLTPREREVLSCLGRGLSNAEISTRLQMAETTVKTHVSRVLGKLGLRSRTQAAVLARELER
ncbi:MULTISPECIES: response regulator [Streptomyces]|uniref:DNA-binding response regulator n=2 Tax=Streptomyces TaxID=1883 RepID=A0A3R7I871_9ACTN|nr:MULTISPECIES: response regulator transcription factor [Streptomyces]KNE81927.1 LuxR family transcriptional regulator [Streptomyces fradiae]OFA51566.1 DNA-binding response regulator [Streptomyces fradiae]PQM19425.1 DNA-binding response regulator [Streptomyces xinghaiensis]RKM95956.1 DNA-binding response regulator [Streptomyces xinghaiensis]RNC69912.1 DNA-binding response regulator [Streptomyces xinghaiensis]